MRPSVSAIVRIFVDALRVSAAFRAAARGDIGKAMQKLSGVGDFTSKTFEVRLLKGAIYSHMANYQAAAANELLAAARAVKADRRLSKVEMNYLVAYAFQYWAHAAREAGLEPTEEMRNILRVDSPVETGSVPSTIRAKFPLKVPLEGIEIR